MYLEGHNHCFMHYFGVKTLSEAHFPPPLMHPGYGTRYLAALAQYSLVCMLVVASLLGSALNPLTLEDYPRSNANVIAAYNMMAMIIPCGSNPRNPRHFDRIEGGRKAPNPLRTTQNTPKCTNYELLQQSKYTMNHPKIFDKPRLRHFLPRFSRLQFGASEWRD